MSLTDWLGAREPAAPPALAARLAELAAAGGTPADTVEACLAAGESLLDRLLADGCGTRAAALDLLAADAFVTYAFEAAGDEPGLVDARAQRAMARIAARAAAAPAA